MHKHKFYITFEDLWIWASETTNPKYADKLDAVEHIFDPVAEIFNGTLTYTDPASKTEKHYPVIADYAAIFNWYIEQFGERYCYRPVEIGRYNPNTKNIMDYDDAVNVVLNLMSRSIKHFAQFNKLKYLKLLETLQYDYNPIQNYNMIEKGLDTTTYNGKEFGDHDVKANQLGGLEVDGPLSSITMGTNPDGTPNLSIEFDMNKKLGSKLNQVSDQRSGQEAESAGTDQVSTKQGANVKTNHFTTTYDDHSEGRLQSYDTSEGSIASVNLSVGENDLPVNGRAYSGAANHPSYKDTKSFEDRNDKRLHDFSRDGNIGVMSTQDMINQEREAARINVLFEFIEELNQYILLNVWN